MVNPFLAISVSASALTKFDAVHEKAEGVLATSKTVTDSNFGSLGEIKTVVPSSQSIEANGYSNVDQNKQSDTALEVAGHVSILTTSRIKVGA